MMPPLCFRGIIKRVAEIEEDTIKRLWEGESQERIDKVDRFVKEVAETTTYNPSTIQFRDFLLPLDDDLMDSYMEFCLQPGQQNHYRAWMKSYIEDMQRDRDFDRAKSLLGIF